YPSTPRNKGNSLIFTALDPFVRHSPCRPAASAAPKYMSPPGPAVSVEMKLGKLPGRMSITRCVLDSVPVVTHSSRPWTPSSASKKSVEGSCGENPEIRELVAVFGAEPSGPAKISLTMRVPALVPSVHHNSDP